LAWSLCLCAFDSHVQDKAREELRRVCGDRPVGSEDVQRYAYLPFGDWPRIGISANSALREAVITLGTLLNRLRFRPVPGKNLAPVMILILRPEGSVWL
jgi:cytochrome P450